MTETTQSRPRGVLFGVNIDHVATLRQARGTRYPDPVQAALLAEEAGADGITVHPREDRRHIQDRDVHLLRETLVTRMNLEMAVTEAMLAFAEQVRPEHCCFVPEKREELTTEGDSTWPARQSALRTPAVGWESWARRYHSLSTRSAGRLMRRRPAVRGPSSSTRGIRVGRK